ncbi:MAG TPA: SirB2 family protein [Bacteroidia bacterium]
MTNFEIIKKIHFVVVTIFFLIYLIKTILLLVNKNEALQAFTKKIKIAEMIISVLFLVSGIYLMTQLPEIKPILIIKITIVLLVIPIAIVGFKKSNKGLATLSFILILASFGIGEMSKNKKAIVSEKALNADGSINGKELYASNCASCHGADGKANLAGALDLSLTKLNDDSVSTIVLKGRNSMSKINGLTPEQAQAIAKYITATIKGK